MPANSQFSAEFLELIIRASREPIEIKLENKSQAVRLRHRFHAFRRKMIRDAEKFGENTAMLAHAQILEQVETALEVHEDGSATLTIRPLDSSFLEAIRKAGISIEQPEVLAPVQPAIPRPKPAPIPDPLDAYLKGTK